MKSNDLLFLTVLFIWIVTVTILINDAFNIIERHMRYCSEPIYASFWERNAAFFLPLLILVWFFLTYLFLTLLYNMIKNKR